MIALPIPLPTLQLLLLLTTNNMYTCTCGLISCTKTTEHQRNSVSKAYNFRLLSPQRNLQSMEDCRREENFSDFFTSLKDKAFECTMVEAKEGTLMRKMICIYISLAIGYSKRNRADT